MFSAVRAARRSAGCCRSFWKSSVRKGVREVVLHNLSIGKKGSSAAAHRPEEQSRFTREMQQTVPLNRLTPAELRLLIRQKDSRIGTTSGLAYGFYQANLLILPSHLANDFEDFCRRNPAPLPLLYRSKPGETSCPPLAGGADVRMDVSQYCVYEEGRLVKTISSLQSCSQLSSTPDLMSDMVSFYLGCSFGFEGKLREAGVPVRNVEQGRNVSMYRTSISCIPAGAFHCHLVVTMRPVPAALLDTAVEVTHLNPLAHGAPVHIGDAALLGIQDLSKPDYGDQVDLQPFDVPVFWACGVTSIEAVLCSKPPLAFSHSPGCMFLTDIPDSPDSTTTASNIINTPHLKPSPELMPLCFPISQNPLLYSLASKAAVEKIRQLEMIIGEDPGQRGIRALFVQDELLHSCLALSHSSSVAITTGFPTHYMHSPPDETDGPPGAIAIATMLLSLGKDVTLLTDKRAVEMTGAMVDEAVRTGVLKTAIPVVTFDGSGPKAAQNFLCHHGDTSKPRFDHLVAIERSGRAEDGNYYNMRGINIKHLVDPIDDLFIAARTISGVSTTGIGDGGNELGMGKVRQKVKSLMPMGDVVACDVPADFAITAGVSNWGGYAVACGLYLLHTCPSHRRYLRKGLGQEAAATSEQLQDWSSCLPSVEKEETFLSTLVRLGIRSGKTGNLGMEVDGLTFHPTHSSLISRLLEATLGSAEIR